MTEWQEAEAFARWNGEGPDDDRPEEDNRPEYDNEDHSYQQFEEVRSGYAEDGGRDPEDER